MASGSDDFNRADSSSLGADWVEDSGDFAIVSSAVRQNTGTGNYFKCRWATAPATNDHYAEADVLSSNSSSRGNGVFVRGAASGSVTYYCYDFFGSDNSYIEYLNAGTAAILATGGAVTASTTYTNCRLEANGTTLTGTRNGSGDASTTHSALTSGSVGLMTYNGGSGVNERLDNFDWADLSAAAGILRQMLMQHGG